jgi:ribosomal protein L40E
MTDTATPSDQDPAATEPTPEQGVCLRCGARGPVGDDGFCDRCEKALEQACL